jgi:hypothetical protein
LNPAELDPAAEQGGHLVEEARYRGEPREIIVVVGTRAEACRVDEAGERELRTVDLVDGQHFSGELVSLDIELERGHEEGVRQYVLPGERRRVDSTSALEEATGGLLAPFDRLGGEVSESGVVAAVAAPRGALGGFAQLPLQVLSEDGVERGRIASLLLCSHAVGDEQRDGEREGCESHRASGRGVRLT